MGPLKGIKVVEFEGIGPAPHCGMMLADMGADVVLIGRKNVNSNAAAVKEIRGKDKAFEKRGKKSILLDLKNPNAAEVALKLVSAADVLIEGFRPGVMERLGLGPDQCLAKNPKLIYGRMTGWGQTGPLSGAAGHDLNYLAVSGALYYSGMPDEAPYAPPVIVGDIGAGAMSLAFGIACALREVRESGKGQVIDAAICDGASYMMTLLASMRTIGMLDEPKGESWFTAGSPWYNTFECSDGQHVTVGALEPQFFALLKEKLGLQDDPLFANQWDKAAWAEGREKLKALFLSKTRQEWVSELEGSDICFGPVLHLGEAANHPHNKARRNFYEAGGYIQPAPAPKFSQTRPEPGQISSDGADGDDILAAIGYTDSEIATLKKDGVV